MIKYRRRFFSRLVVQTIKIWFILALLTLMPKMWLSVPVYSRGRWEDQRNTRYMAFQFLCAWLLATSWHQLVNAVHFFFGESKKDSIIIAELYSDYSTLLWKFATHRLIDALWWYTYQEWWLSIARLNNQRVNWLIVL